MKVVMTYFIQGQNQKSMFIKLHEGDDNNEVKKKETIESDITHEKKSKNDETEVESNGKRIRRPIEILMGGLNMISITQT